MEKFIDNIKVENINLKNNILQIVITIYYKSMQCSHNAIKKLKKTLVKYPLHVEDRCSPIGK